MLQPLVALGFSGLSGMKGNVMKHPLALALTLTTTLAIAQAPTTTDSNTAPGTFNASGATTSTSPTGSSTVLPSDRTPSGTATMGASSADSSTLSSSPRRKTVRGNGRAMQDDSWSTLYPGKQ
jgi:hypothetical protein